MKVVREIWREAFPEMLKHLKPAEDTVTDSFNDYRDDPDTMYVGRTLTGRIRRRCTFTSACNYPLNVADVKWGEFRESHLTDQRVIFTVLQADGNPEPSLGSDPSEGATTTWASLSETVIPSTSALVA